jgi:hypothetical protein
VIEITSGPSGQTTSTSATFTWLVNVRGVAQVHCQLDTVSDETCRSPRTYSGLALGPHRFLVQALGPSGSQLGSDARSWTIVAPIPTITTPRTITTVTPPTTTATTMQTTTTAAPPTNKGPLPPLAHAIVGSAGQTVLSGTSGDDVILGLGGNRTLVGGAGDDTLVAGRRRRRRHDLRRRRRGQRADRRRPGLRHRLPRRVGELTHRPDLEERLADRDACVRDENVDAAEQLVDAAERARDLDLVGDVAEQRGLEARDARMGGLHLALADRKRDDTRSLGQEAAARRLADPARAAGDDDALALEPVHAATMYS